MARITVEDCLRQVNNMYELVQVATRRARQLYRGSDPLVRSKNRVPVTALREVATGKIKPVFPGAAGTDESTDLPH